MTDKERLDKIRAGLDEFDAELKYSGCLGDQFQVGYYVHAEDVRWLLEQHTKLITAADEAGQWMMGKHVDNLSLAQRNEARRIRIGIEWLTKP